MWRFATEEEAATLCDCMKRVGTLNPRFGRFRPSGLVVHASNDGALDAAMYFVADTFYTLASEMWSFSATTSVSVRGAVRLFLDANPEASRHIVGFVHVDNTKWVNALVKGGGRIERFCVQVNHHEP